MPTPRGLGASLSLLLLLATWHQFAAGFGGRPAASRPTVQLDRAVMEYVAARFVSLADPPTVVMSRPVRAAELPMLGLIDTGRADDELLQLVVLRGQFGLNPWLPPEEYGAGDASRDQSIAGYIVLVMNPRALAPVAWQTSRNGGLFRAVLEDPTLPEETVPLGESILRAPPPWSREQPAGVPTPGASLPCSLPVPGGSWCGVAPGCDDPRVPPIGSCGLVAPIECYSRAISAIPDVCGRGDPKHFVQIDITDEGFFPAELTLPQRTEVLWVNRGQRPHAVATANGVGASGLIEPGGRWSLTFFQPLDFQYFDEASTAEARARLKIEGCLLGAAPGPLLPAPVHCFHY